MSEESDGKRQLGRLQLQRKQVAADELEDLVASLGGSSASLGGGSSPARGGGSSASLSPVSLSAAGGSPSAPGVVELAAELPMELAGVIVPQHGVATVDLRKVHIPVAALRLVAREVACEQLALAVFVDAEHLYVAMADLNDRQLIGELEFTTGRTVRTYPANHGVLRDVIESAYAAEAAGQPSYRGPLARSAGPLGEVDPAPGQPAAPAFDDELSRPLSKLPGAVYGPGPLDAGDSLVPPPPSTQMQRILVVDDNDDIRRLLVRVFRDREYEVFESASGQDALQKVRECSPDLMLLDAMLPDVHGFDVCRRIKSSRRYGHVPVVMLSAVYRGWRFAEDARRSYGVDAFIEKPFRIGDVVSAVERALAGAGRSQPPEAEAEGLAADELKAGMEAYASGDAAAAVEHLKRGLTIDPLSFRLHYHLGLLYGKQENVFEAIHELETAVDLRSRDFSTLKNLAVLYQRAGFRLKATEMWERALGSAPDDATRTSIRNHLVSLL